MTELSIKFPTPIQVNCIPEILNGKDVIGSAKTGSGKTAAFALPILQKLSEDPFGIFAVVLTPTRELAFQIAEQFKVLGTGINLKQVVVVGGLDMMQQAIELSKKPHIIIATPGRFADHIKSSHEAVDLRRLRFLVLDEADRLLSESFEEDLECILDNLPTNKRQTLLFSATMTKEIEELKFGGNPPFVYSGNTRYDTVDKLDQRYLLIPFTVKDVYLVYCLKEKFGIEQVEKKSDNTIVNGHGKKSIVKKKKPNLKIQDENEENNIKSELNTSVEKKSLIIFGGKWKTCERLYLMLRELGFKCTALHSRLSQKERLASIAKFKGGIVPILITTDVGSRGLDIPTVSTVINYDLPADPTDYIHRIGRTARAGRGGVALSLITERDVEVLLNIEKSTKKKLIEFEGLIENEVLDLMNEVSVAKRVANLTLVDESKSKFGHKLRVYNNFK
ncbi:hypothetical protein HK099_008194 [Clydaea vesicula]|uniref:Uncharacterized protein n=1 Tax=Clydaea vesicula TaxID=447962 RepID=A0AAD5TW84_9FUNG|nr:hypothetical protein HK099_008194 [Clydaea vesicula]